MLKQLSIENFTVFPEAHFEFSPGLNVIVGENGTGKSHILKLAYSAIAVSEEERRKSHSDEISKPHLQRRYAEKLLNTLRPDTLGRLASRIQGRKRCEVKLKFDQPALNCSFGLATNSKTEVQISQLPQMLHDKAPVFLPTRELLSIYPGFVSMYESRRLQFDETYRDVCLLLGEPTLKGAREKKLKKLLLPLEKAMGGKIVLDDNDRFYLSIPGKGKMEIPLVAEGVRKLAMIARLINTGALLDKGYLFWDEPEATLNPRLVRLVAGIVCALADAGIQVFVTTHSYFLLKEIQLVSKKQPKELTRYFSLLKHNDGVQIESGTSIDDLHSIVALDEELAQFDREQEHY